MVELLFLFKESTYTYFAYLFKAKNFDIKILHSRKFAEQAM